MQTVIQVIATGHGSLRSQIMRDPKLEKKSDAHGALNLEWHGRSNTLICRVVTKLGNKPNSIIGDFIDYLLARHQSRILAIHIMRRPRQSD
ncbi:MAG: hypothetical protein DME57_02390 [Verrucomicrobia bacterium]|nr:MAG: hypothetical protein DME57_02390 [Verrucomicrobiota bacterium]